MQNVTIIMKVFFTVDVEKIHVYFKALIEIEDKNNCTILVFFTIGGKTHVMEVIGQKITFWQTDTSLGTIKNAFESQK